MTNEMVGSTVSLFASDGVFLTWFLAQILTSSFLHLVFVCIFFFLLGRGEYTYPDGKRFEGEYKDDKPNGRGKQTASDGAVLFDGGWNQGEFLGS